MMWWLAVPCPHCGHTSTILVVYQQTTDLMCRNRDCGAILGSVSHSTTAALLPWSVISLADEVQALVDSAQPDARDATATGAGQ